MNKSFVVLLIALFCSLSLAAKYHNQYQPVIGILTQPTNDLNQTKYPPDQYQYIATSYYKWLESAGAKVIPIPYDLPEDQLDYLFSRVNGLLFPGGDASLWVNEDTWEGFSNMTLTGQRLLEKIVQTNRNGTYFPLWGTCMGYELIILALTNSTGPLSRLNSTNHVLDTQLVNRNFSRIYNSFSKGAIDSIEHEKALYYNHHYGLSLANFFSSPKINRFFDLTAISTDSSGTKFVSTLEAKDFPIYVNQFHPEKNAYEWLNSVDANHSPSAITAAQEFANFFVNEARKNNQVFTEQEIEHHNIEKEPLKTVYDGFVSVFINKNQNFTSSVIPQPEDY